MQHNATRAQALRESIEASLAGSFAGALSPRPYAQRPLLPFGIAELDAAAGGGAPAGAVTELTGLGSTGKTSAAMRLLAGAMQSGKVCAWVDVCDSFDPRSGAENGMLLPQLLWVRCGGEGSDQAEPQSGDPGSRLRPGGPPGVQGRAGAHPREEERGLDEAVSGLFRSASAPPSPFAAARTPSHGSGRSEEAWPNGSRIGMHSTRARQQVGTPGAPNAPLSPYKRAPFTPHPAFRPVPRSEQAASDRQGGRKETQPGSQARLAPPVQLSAAGKPAGFRRTGERPWARLDQALRAADLLLAGGGFAVIVLDLGEVAPEHALRIPAATWFRFRAAADASGTAFLLLSQTPCARSSARLVAQFEPLRLQLAGGVVVESVHYRAEIARRRFGNAPRKDPKTASQASSYRVSPQEGSTGKLCAFYPANDESADRRAEPSPPATLLAWKRAGTRASVLP